MILFPAMAEVEIPYIKQEITKSNKGMCGAASLAMVYASFGKTYAQNDIFGNIAISNKKGSSTGVLYRMSRDAIDKGFYSLAITAKEPKKVYQVFPEIKEKVRIILSHKVKVNWPPGHYTVLVDITKDDIVVHDPAVKPLRHIPKGSFNELWKGRCYMLLAVTNVKSDRNNCSVCGKHIPDEVVCPRNKCRKTITLQPKEILGCTDNNCSGRIWAFIYCPYCGVAIDEISGRQAKSSALN